jgi:pSer/pThr/pTyr-binding forkhead associated (FHA) protein
MSATTFKLIRIADAVEFPIASELLVGRLAESGLQITQGLPSRRHAVLTVVDQMVWVEDLGSVNGTYINGKRLSAKSALKSGDKVRFDVEEFMFRTVVAVADDGGAPTMYRAPDAEEKPALVVPSADPPKPPVAPISDVRAPGNEPAVAPPIVPVAASASKPAAVAPPSDGSGLFKRPGAWADPDSDDGANKTKFMDPNALKVMLDAPKLPPVGAVDVPTLVVASGSTRGASFKLKREDAAVSEWTIGSGGECNVSIADAGVSALHAKLVNDGNRWKLIDQMSANGTYVNGKRSNVSYLGNGDRVGFGPIECEFKLPAGSSTQAVASSDEPVPNRKLKLGAAAGVVLSLVLLAWWLAR